ncbi:MAG TPA: YkgJ family cysteine cluster protein [Bdellovibrionales bacterium]|nr:YkgJ family cysteine cluster protein [Bdellovibrionales bacterium]
MKRPDVDRPSEWVRYRESLCQNCWAGCCTMPVEVTASDLVRLGIANADETQGSLKKLAKRLEREKIVKNFRASTGLFMLEQKQNRDCIFLGEDRLCTVYERRPDVCRKFPSIGPRPGFCPAGRRA